MILEENDWRLVHVTHYDPEGRRDLSSTIAYAIAAANDVDPIDLTPPLATIVDLDAIEDLITNHAGGERRIEFRYGEWMVDVRSDDRIRVYEPVEPADEG